MEGYNIPGIEFPKHTFPKLFTTLLSVRLHCFHFLLWFFCSIIVYLLFTWFFKNLTLGVIQKVPSLRRGGGESFKSEQKWTGGGGVLAFVYIRFFKKNAEIFKMKFYIYSPVFPIDHNEDWFFGTLLLCTTFLCTVHYFPCTFLAKMAIYSLVIDNVYFVISS